MKRYLSKATIVRLVSFIMVISISYTLCACKNKDVKAAESAISDIGTVSIDSEEKIQNAEKLYNILTDSEKSQVENRAELVDARTAYDSIVEENKKQVLAEKSQIICNSLDEAASICDMYMDSIYDAWHYGIYNSEDDMKRLNKNASLYFYCFSGAVSYIEYEDLEAVYTSVFPGKDFSTAYFAHNNDMDFDMCVYFVECALENKGIYTRLDNCLNDAEKCLKELADLDSDSDEYIKLQAYYVSVKSYADFFKSPSGSFSDLSSSMTGYEQEIANAKANVDTLNL